MLLKIKEAFRRVIGGGGGSRTVRQAGKSVRCTKEKAMFPDSAINAVDCCTALHAE
jgi:hypothetical protein